MARHSKGRRTNSPPPGEAWLWHTLPLLSSPAWRGRSIACVRLIEFLELEHLRHGANDNGRLLAPYTQLVSFGIGRRFIADAIKEAERRGLVSVDRGGKRGTTITEVSRYRLTYFWTRTQKDGIWHWAEPSDDWRGREGPFDVPSREVEIGALKCTRTVHHSELAPVHYSELARPQALEIPNAAVVHYSEPPSISGEGTAKPQRQAGRSALPKSAAVIQVEEPPAFLKRLPDPKPATNRPPKINGVKHRLLGARHGH